MKRYKIRSAKLRNDQVFNLSVGFEKLDDPDVVNRIGSSVYVKFPYIGYIYIGYIYGENRHTWYGELPADGIFSNKVVRAASRRDVVDKVFLLSVIENLQGKEIVAAIDLEPLTK